MQVGTTESIRTRISDLSERSQNCFLSLARGFPELMREMRAGIAAATQHLNHLSQQRTFSGQRNDELQEIQHDVQQVLIGSEEYFEALSHKDQATLESLRDGMDRLENLRRSIVDLRDDALDLEVLAVNSIVTARKAGDHGRGFAYVASELRRLAASMVTETKQLDERGAEALNSLQEFRMMIAEIETFYNRFYGKLQERLSSGFEGLNHVLTDLIRRLSTTVHNAEQVERPLRTLMTEIQVQDIVVQSLAHVDVVMERAAETETVEADDGTRVSMTGLSISLLNDIRAKLAATTAVLSENIAALGQVFTQAQGKRSTPTEFEGPVAILESIVAGIETVSQNREKLNQDGQATVTQIAGVVDRMSAINGRAGRLYPLQVLSRIQVARDTEGHGNYDAIAGIQELANRIADDITGAERELSQGVNQVERIIHDQSRTVEETVQVSHEFAGNIARIKDRLLHTQTELANRLGHFTVFSDRFQDHLHRAEHEIIELESLVSDIDHLISDLEEHDRKSGNTQFDRDRTSIEHAVASMLDRFTIARHKTSAASIVGMEVDHGDKEGEFTLF
jgi:methyl-accepting chemotaxis protein